MKRHTLFILFICICKFVGGQTPYELVNPFIGTGGHGHCYPGATAPHGAVQLSPDTRTGDWDACAGYHYDDEYILGFSHTHLSGTGCADLGDILIRPFEGKAHFSHQNEKAEPGYYEVTLDNGMKCELAATTYAGIHRYTLPATAPSGLKLHIDLNHILASSEFISEADAHEVSPREIVGYRKTRGWAKEQNTYFVIRFDRPISSTYLDKYYIQHNSGEMGMNAVLDIDVYGERNIVFKIGVSNHSIEAARENMNHDIPGYDLDATRRETRHKWEEELGRIEVGGGTLEQRQIFYTSLYHCLIVPNIVTDCYDTNPRYSTFSLWDTFRAWHPLMALIDPKLTNDIILSMLDHYDRTGLLPVWTLQDNETNCMIGYHAVAAIWDAYQKGIQNYDAEKALRAMIASTNQTQNGSAYYDKNGFIPKEVTNESVSKQLEFAYDDWCIAQMANALGHKDLYEKYIARSKNYAHLFDGRSRFFRGKGTNGFMSHNFNPYQVTRDFTEANAWQYRFFVPHDVNGLVQLFGGKEPFVKALDSLFTTSSDVVGAVSDITGLIGQYAQGNEPSHHAAFLYDYIGMPDKTNQYVHRILNEMYRATPDGLCGNEDCGQMSAWYIWASMGLYPLCPGSGQYASCTPIWDYVKINGTDIKNYNLMPFFYKESAERKICSTPTPYRAILSTKKQKNIVTIYCATPDADIRYTLDGKEPTLSSKHYKKTFKVKGVKTLRMRAFKDGYAPSKTITVTTNNIK